MIKKCTLQCERSTDQMPTDELSRRLIKRWWKAKGKQIYINKYHVFIDTFSEEA